MTAPLKPCPFCGGEAFRLKAGVSELVSCSNQDCTLDSYDFSVEGWNRRAQPSQAQQAGVTEAMVDAAWLEFHAIGHETKRDAIRAGIAAALSAQQGEGEG
jgi:hypothetical protein